MNRVSINKIIAAIILIHFMVLTGCSYTTQVRSVSPYFDGVLKLNDEAINNAKIILSLDGIDTLCHKEVKFTHTNEQGEFSLSASKEEHHYKPFINYQLDEWVLCAVYNKERYTLYSNNRYASGNVTESIYLNCDLANRPINQTCDVSH